MADSQKQATMTAQMSIISLDQHSRKRKRSASTASTASTAPTHIFSADDHHRISSKIQDLHKPTAQKSTHPSRLLALANELRNTIVGYVLTEDEPITVDAKLGFTEPGLLLTCKQLRTEAAPVFYANNTFLLDQQDHDSDMLVLWKKKTKAVQQQWKVKPQIVDICAHQTPSWPNVRVWLERLYTGEVDISYPMGQRNIANEDLQSRVQRMALELVFITTACLRAEGNDFSEEKVETSHQILKKTNVLWT
ncbi:uncharacterized protein MYCGRDRAFT_96972 [Zymoseptoria tritici IPO323]|uniref:Uncharacterized protein n=1 Tax=Zymoseptoria tritici (strain CBS 115943 / IPO323) TaxID=336722 RepID=F9XNH3_ZYMTI|nr:uncharacterized protein MYCGRDRAFT_96972 [Zymoseptoria tritici IPO323]EGP82872.1 hypothetical protein MYCGRDRAFT_96972 [Zymoseptoria tritici IPO323]